VELAMIVFKSCLDEPHGIGSAEMRNRSLALAHMCRSSLGSSWGFETKQLEGDDSRLVEQSIKPTPERDR
jgi:hypothetical protein